MKIDERVAKLEAIQEVHYEQFQEMYKNNREDHAKIFEGLNDNQVRLEELKTLSNNHLKHHEKTEHRNLILYTTFLLILVPTIVLFLRLCGVL